MKRSRLITRLLACAMTCGTALAIASGKPEKLLVMLQGSSAAELSELVTKNGGTITHDLHIINAVGASLTQAQLDEVLKSPLITRHIDDLSVSESPDEQPDEDAKTCDVKGSLELEIGESDISWTLYNKLPEPAVLESLVLKWPIQLGGIENIFLGEININPAQRIDNHAGYMRIDYGEAGAPVLSGTLNLQISFKSKQPPKSETLFKQSDFDLKANFRGDCSTKLIPGYEDNHHNFHYSSVAGVAPLHLQGITGKGVTVAVLDSGLWEHDSISRDTSGRYRVVARYDAIDNISGKEVFDESGHGTHMISVIAHSGAVSNGLTPTGTFQGVSPDVNIVAVKVLDIEGQGHLLDLIRGVQWVVDNRKAYDIRVLNLSFAQEPRWNYWDDPVNQAVMRAWASGITVVAAAGNEGPEKMTIGSPANLPYIITVGAVTDSWTPNTKDDDYIPDFSSRGPTPDGHIKPDLVAPGGHITGITRPGAQLTKEHPEDILRTGEFVSTGSSQASALVSGIVALLLQLEPDLSPDDIKCKLISSAEPAINKDGLLAYSPFQQGHGYVSAVRAVMLGQRGCGNPDLDISADLNHSDHFQGPAIIDGKGKVSLPGLEDMISTHESEKGLSTTRKWGVKAHIERGDMSLGNGTFSNPLPFNWQELYLIEKAAIEKLSQETKD